MTSVCNSCNQQRGGARTGTKDRFKHINTKYPFQARFWISVGVIITTKKFQSQFADTEMACLDLYQLILSTLLCKDWDGVPLSPSVQG